MGVIRKQSIQTSILSYLGVGLGYINVVLLFPAFFAAEEFGLTRILGAIIGIVSQFALFGLTNGIIRFFPRFREGDDDNLHGLLGLSFLVGTMGVLVAGFFMWLADDLIIDHYADRSQLISQFYFLLLPYLAFEVFYQILASFSRGLFKAVINVFFREVFLRVSTTLLIVLFHYQLIDFSGFMVLFVSQYAVMALGLALYIMAIGRFKLGLDLEFLRPELKREMLKYSSFTLLSNVGSYVLVSIDLLMVGSMIGLQYTAYYAVAFYIAALLNIPRTAINNISVPVISEAWRRNDTATIQDIYVKSSINQLLVGTLLFVGLWANEASIFSMLPAEYAEGKWVLFFILLARLIDVGFGINDGIIATSKAYTFETISNIVLILLAIGLNLIFIPLHGIVGAAMATALSLSLFNIGRYLFLKVKFGFDPFTWRSAVILLVGVLVFGLSCLLPEQDHFVVDMLLRSLIVAALYIPTVLSLKLSPEATDLYKLALNRLRGKR
jgi:O-antigen/teichoic acid export membrane protein